VLEALLTGVLLGVISGLVPGIHNNTFSALIISYLPLLYLYFAPEEIAMVIFANAITHTFIDILPSIFIGVPDEDTALSVLPGHEMVLEGRGFHAVTLSAISSFLSFLIAMFLFILLFSSGKWFWNVVSSLTPLFLTSIIVFLLASEKKDIYAPPLNIWLKRFLALTILTFSGIIGYFSFMYSYLIEIRGGSSVFIPMMLGFFAVPVISSSIKTSKLPKQSISINIMPIRLKHIITGCFSGFLVSLFPGVSSGIAAVISARGTERENYLLAVSGANTSNALLCFAVLFTSGKTRSGAASAFREVIGFSINFNEVLNLLIVGFVVALLAFTITLILGAGFSKAVNRLENFSRISTILLIFFPVYTFFMTGILGLVILIFSSATGLLSLRWDVKRVYCMGCIIIPVLLKYLIV
jgi:putative membrane protein